MHEYKPQCTALWYVQPWLTHRQLLTGYTTSSASSAENTDSSVFVARPTYWPYYNTATDVQPQCNGAQYVVLKTHIIFGEKMLYKYVKTLHYHLAHLKSCLIVLYKSIFTYLLTPDGVWETMQKYTRKYYSLQEHLMCWQWRQWGDAPGDTLQEVTAEWNQQNWQWWAKIGVIPQNWQTVMTKKSCQLFRKNSGDTLICRPGWHPP